MALLRNVSSWAQRAEAERVSYFEQSLDSNGWETEIGCPDMFEMKA